MHMKDLEFSGHVFTYTFLGKDSEAEMDVLQVIELGVDPEGLQSRIRELRFQR